MSLDARTIPLDPTSTADLADVGLDYTRVTADGFDGFLRAVSRGFLDREPSTEQLAWSRQALDERRMTAVYDRAGAHPAMPVATIDSWITELTTAPGRTLPLWAISGVTVAPTHRRRGVARALLTGELRAAADAGLAIAGLTVSEATIYGRWGFSPAVYTTDWTIDTARARWVGPRPDGRLDFVEQDDIADRLGEIYERTRTQRAGRVEGWPGLWRRTAGLRPDADDKAKIRAVSYRDAEGVARGILVYVLADRDDYSRHELAIHALYADGDDAAAALWRFALEHDLVATVTASLRPVDEPLRWMIADQRAAKVSLTDHHWLRVLDVPAALSARPYAVADALVVTVDDPLGFAAGTWRIETDAEGSALVEPVDAPADAEMSAGALGSLYLGGVSAATLAAAGHVSASPDAVARIDALFRQPQPPLLDLWY